MLTQMSSKPTVVPLLLHPFHSLHIHFDCPGELGGRSKHCLAGPQFGSVLWFLLLLGPGRVRMPETSSQTQSLGLSKAPTLSG